MPLNIGLCVEEIKRGGSLNSSLHNLFLYTCIKVVLKLEIRGSHHTNQQSKKNNIRSILPHGITAHKPAKQE
jgi:hypothetical protein